jgi:hypothetical protein
LGRDVSKSCGCCFVSLPVPLPPSPSPCSRSSVYQEACKRSPPPPPPHIDPPSPAAAQPPQILRSSSTRHARRLLHPRSTPDLPLMGEEEQSRRPRLAWGTCVPFTSFFVVFFCRRGPAVCEVGTDCRVRWPPRSGFANRYVSFDGDGRRKRQVVKKLFARIKLEEEHRV